MVELNDKLKKLKDLGISFSMGNDQVEIERIPSGSIGLDRILGGGYPRGRMIEFYGDFSSGKSLMAYLAIKEAQKRGLTTALVDAENSYTQDWAINLGIDPERLYVISAQNENGAPRSGESLLEDVSKLIEAEIDLIVVDSVSALTPQIALDKALDEGAAMAEHARMLSKCLQKVNAYLGAHNKTSLIFINQQRCLDKNTFVWCNGKLTKFCNIKKGDMLGDIKVIDVTDSGTMNGVELRTKYYQPLRISLNHKQPIIRGNKYMEVLGKDLKPGDWLIRPEKDYRKFMSKNVNKTKLNFAFLLGLVFSDGYIADYETDSYIEISEKNKARIHIVKDFLDKAGIPYNTRVHGSSKQTTFSIRGAYKQKIIDSGLEYTSANKTIPTCILNSSLDEKIMFLSGAFLDAHLAGKALYFTGAENDVALTQFQELFYGLGIDCQIFTPRDTSKHKNKNRKYIRFSGESYNKLINLIPVLESRLKTTVTAHKDSRSHKDVVPYTYGCMLFDKYRVSSSKSQTAFYRRLMSCKSQKLNFDRKSLIELGAVELQGKTFCEITEIKNVIIDAIDVTVEGGLFEAQGFLTHNSNPNVMFGNPNKSTGGKALEFYDAIKMLVFKRTGTEFTYYKDEKNKDEGLVGQRIKITTEKNKLYRPKMSCEFDVFFDIGPKNLSVGVDTVGELLTECLKADIITKPNAQYYEYKDRKYRGALEMMKAIKEDEDLQKELFEALDNVSH